MQVSSTNVLVGVEGRTSLLYNLSTALKLNPQYFGEEARPGNIIGTVYVTSSLTACSCPRFQIFFKGNNQRSRGMCPSPSCGWH